MKEEDLTNAINQHSTEHFITKVWFQLRYDHQNNVFIKYHLFSPISFIFFKNLISIIIFVVTYSFRKS